MSIHQNFITLVQTTSIVNDIADGRSIASDVVFSAMKIEPVKMMRIMEQNKFDLVTLANIYVNYQYGKSKKPEWMDEFLDYKITT